MVDEILVDSVMVDIKETKTTSLRHFYPSVLLYHWVQQKYFLGLTFRRNAGIPRFKWLAGSEYLLTTRLPTRGCHIMISV